MRRTMIFVLAGVLTLGLAAGAMAFGGGMMGGGGYGPGWGGHMMQPGYHMGYDGGYGANGAGPGYGTASCPGWQANNGLGNPAYGPPPKQRRGPQVPVNPNFNQER